MSTLKPHAAIGEAAADALRVQDACNLQAIVRTLAEHLPAIAADGGSTDAINHHPVVQLFMAKLMDLSGLGLADLDVYGPAYRACKLLQEAR
jgi:hypothetical protein